MPFLVPHIHLNASSKVIRFLILYVCLLDSCTVGFDDLLMKYPTVNISPSKRKCQSNKVPAGDG